MEIEHDWRKLFRMFSNLKTLCVDDEFIEELSCCLLVDDGGHSVELLPELNCGSSHTRTQAGSSNVRDVFFHFINAHQNIARLITLICP